MRVSSSAGTEAQLPEARSRVCPPPPGQGGLGPSRRDGAGGDARSTRLAPHFGFDFPIIKHQLALALLWLGGGRILAGSSPGATPLRSRSHRGWSISGTCTGSGASPVSPVPAPGAERLRYQHQERSISGTYTGSGASPVSPVPAPGPGPAECGHTG